ncbi:MAG: hypothetical protein Q6363_006195, partial [Candidatus Njordarchaeota archaeon]
SSLDVINVSDPFEQILNKFVLLYNQLESTADKKLCLSQFVELIETIKWNGLAKIVEKISEDILAKEKSGTVLATIARIVAKNSPETALNLIRTIDSSPDVMFEWEFDAALAYGLLAEAFLELDDRSKAKEYLDKSIEYALKIPDRSDRSIALARLMPLIYDFYGFEKSLEYISRITYEVKKSEAIVKLITSAGQRGDNIDFRKLLSLAPREKRPYILSILAKTIAHMDINRAKELTQQFIPFAESDVNSIDNLRALVNFLDIYLYNGLDKNTAGTLFNKIKSAILANIHKREFMSLVFDVVDTLLRHNYKNEGQKLLSEMRTYIGDKDPASNVFMYNRLTRIYSKYGYFDDANLFLSNCYEVLQGIDIVVRTPLLVETISTTLFVINEFPDQVPIQLAEKYADQIRPAEIAEVKIKLFRDNLAYLKETYTSISLDDAINEIILIDRMLNLRELEKRAKEILMSIIEKRDGSFVLHYVLKYAYEANLPEATRLEVLEFLGSATTALLQRRIDTAKEYLELALREFERRKVPLLPIVLRFFQEYLLMTLS